jgi:hypothetical protein
MKKTLLKKLRLAKVMKIRAAPRWADIKKFGMKHARTRRIPSYKKRWKRTSVKV